MFSIHFSHVVNPTQQQMVCIVTRSVLPFWPMSCESLVAKNLGQDASPDDEQADRLKAVRL